MQTKRNQGFSVAEMIIYVAVLAIFSVLIVQTIVSFSSSLREMKASKAISFSASVAMERITREIRKATDVDLASSVLDSNSGRLKLVTTNDSGYVQNVTFALEGSVVNLYENDLLSGPLTQSQASTTKLIFRLLQNGKTKAVKIEMTVAAEVGPFYRTEDFYDTVILRNSP